MLSRQIETERRRLARMIVSGRVDVVDCDSGRTLGIVANMNFAGILLLGNANIRVGQRYRVRLEPWEPMPLVSLEFELECRWRRGESGDDNRWVGFEIVDASREALDAIALLGDRELRVP